jgi:hypothetical protein
VRVAIAGPKPAIARTHLRNLAVKIRLSVDRFEGDKKQFAVLVTDDGQQFSIPRGLLPRRAKAGDVLTLQIEVDAQATRDVADSTKRVQDDLKKRDPGGDIRL